MLCLTGIVERQPEIIILNDSLYWRGSFTAGGLHEERYAILLAAPYYPPDATLLTMNMGKYPVKQIVESLRSRHGEDYIERYRPPSKLILDVLDEATPASLAELNRLLQDLRRVFDARIVTGSWEQDFARTTYLATPVEGDKALFQVTAESALEESRVQVSGTARRLLNKDAAALVAMGMAVVTLERMNPYTSYLQSSSWRDREGAGLAESYTS